MAKIADAVFTGGSGTKYNFEVYTVGQEFNAVGAVYVFTTRILNQQQRRGVHTFAYVGQTGDLSERFDNHHKAQAINNCNPNCICVHVENNEHSRLAIERDLIAGHTTRCND